MTKRKYRSIEEKKDGKSYPGKPDSALFTDVEEKALGASLSDTAGKVHQKVTAEDFAGAMSLMADVRKPVDAFFDKVKVNADDKSVRENRLKLLKQLVETAHLVADFSKIEG